MHTAISYPQKTGLAIKFLYSLRAENAIAMDQFHRRLPDGTLDLIFNLGAPMYSSRDGITYEQLPDVVLAGLYPDRNFIRYSGAVDLVVAVLQPGAAHLVVRDQLIFYRESACDAALIWGSEVRTISDQLRTLTNTSQQHAIVEQFLLRQVHQMRQYADEGMQNRILHAVKQIDHQQGNIDLPHLCRGVYMSERDFRRKFTGWVGMSPKQYAGIIRVKAFSKQYTMIRLPRVAEAKKNSQIELVADLGYADGSHLRKEFKKIAGVGPGDYFGQLGKVAAGFMEIM
jgi:AraC-like DNA-binding protein